MTELGPFRVNPDGKTLWLNKYAWNNLANVIFLESPAGVGFSYSNRSSDYVTGDEQTALDTYTFLVNWLERFPEYKTRDFYITGESYAGHYIPQLAALILKNNEITNQTAFINLKGIAIGNAYVDNEDMLLGRFNMMWTHSLISDEIHEGIQENCNFSLGVNVSNVCKNYEIQAYDIIGNLDRYEIYAPLCSSNSTAPSISGFDPCSNDYVDAYLNTPEVQKALHANMTGISTWNLCNVNLRRNYEGHSLTVLPTIQELMTSGISIWMYSGDLDLVVPVTSTKLSLTKLGAPIKTPWYAWYNEGEVGGFVVEYGNLTFVTVRGSGHFVPSYQPERALSLFSSFLNGTLPPSNM